MPRYIDAELFSKNLMMQVYLADDEDFTKAFVKGMELVKKAEEETPTADVQEVKHAKNLCEDFPSLFGCSLCNWYDDDTTTGNTSVYNYCPNCGAKMDGGGK